MGGEATSVSSNMLQPPMEPEQNDVSYHYVCKLMICTFYNISFLLLFYKHVNYNQLFFEEGLL